MFYSTGPWAKFCEAFLEVIYVNAIKKFTNNVINLAKKSCSGFGLERVIYLVRIAASKRGGGGGFSLKLFDQINNF